MDVGSFSTRMKMTYADIARSLEHNQADNNNI